MSYIGNPIVSTDFPKDTFSGNGSTTAFTMQIAPASVNSVIVVVSGITQDPSTYTISGTTLTFSAAPPTGTSNISVRHLGVAGIPNTPSANSVGPSAINSSYALWNLVGSTINYTAGNVGIGTSSPTKNLHVKGVTNTNAEIRIQANASNDYSSILLFGDNVDDSGAIQYSNYDNHMQFDTNSTERMRIKTSGAVQASKNGVYKAWSGNVDGHQFRIQDTNQVALSADANNASFAYSIVRSLCDRSASSAYTFFTCTSGDLNDDEFVLRGDGQGYADGSWNAGGADYAEYFEWVDGNPTAEDRRGFSVSLVGNKIKIAEAGETIIGVISGNPSVVGDSAWNRWSEKYLRDDFGTYLREPCEVWSWTDSEGLDHSYEFDKVPNGVIVPEDKTIVLQDRQVLNPSYDETQEYTPREQRKEWDCVGLMGKLRIRKNQVTNVSWIKMRDISDTVEEWLVK